eukprot:TRINITY_DN5926_c0_g1_i3.p1 TRINITY_DN5926_c0_g1~~TRINITY_DN5926_c0_g1_i3.p1  ORF type:complete len:1405 (+),score=389.28 TRINITY_DN5926_c0_g1_i3:158-4372(+)
MAWWDSPEAPAPRRGLSSQAAAWHGPAAAPPATASWVVPVSAPTQAPAGQAPRGASPSGGTLIGPNGLDVGALQRALFRGGDPAAAAAAARAVATAQGREPPPAEESPEPTPPPTPPPPAELAPPLCPGPMMLNGVLTMQPMAVDWLLTGELPEPPLLAPGCPGLAGAAGAGKRPDDAAQDASWGRIPVPCRYFLSGVCTKGDGCRFLHCNASQPENVHIPDHHREKYQRAIEHASGRAGGVQCGRGAEAGASCTPGFPSGAGDCAAADDSGADAGASTVDVSLDLSNPHDQLEWLVISNSGAAWGQVAAQVGQIEDEARVWLCSAELEAFNRTVRAITSSISESVAAAQRERARRQAGAERRAAAARAAAEDKAWGVAAERSAKDRAPPAAAAEPDEVVLVKNAAEPMGLMWKDHTLLDMVEPDSAGWRCGLQRFVRRRLAAINGNPVERLADIKQASKGCRIVLRFHPAELQLERKKHPTPPQSQPPQQQQEHQEAPPQRGHHPQQQQQQQQQALRQALPQHPAYDRPPAPPQRPQPPQGGDPKDSVGRPHMHPAQPQSQHQQQQHQQMRILRQQQFQQEQLGQHFRRQLQLLQEQEAGGSSALVQPPISTQQPQSMMLVQSLQILPLPQAGCFPVLAPAQPPQRSPTPPGSEYDKDCGAYEGLEEAVGSSSPVHTAAAPAQHHQPLPPAELGRALPTPAEAAAAEAELARRGGADGSSSGRQRPRHAAAKPAGPPVPLSGVIAPAAKTQQQRRSAREERRRSESLKEEKMALARKEMQQRMQLQQGRRDQETDRPPTCTDQPPATSDSQEEAGTDPSPTPLRRDQQRVQAPSCAPPSTSAASQKKKERRELGSAALPLPQQQHKPHQKHHQQQQQQQEQQEQQKLLQQNRRSSEETSSCASESNAPPEDEWATAVLWGKPAKAAAAPERPSRQKQGMPSKVAHKLLQQQQKHQKQLLRQQLREERELQVAQRARQCSGEAGAEQGAAPLATSADAEEAARPVPSPPPPEEPPQAGSPHPSPPPVPPPPSPPLPLPLSSPCDGTQVQRLKEPAPVPDSTEAIQRRQPSPPCTAELNPLASPHGMRSKRHALGDRPQLSMTFTDDGQRMGGILRVPLSPTIRHKQQQQRREAAPPADPSPGHADPHLFLEFLGAVCLVAVVGWPLRLLAIMVSMCRLMSRVKHPPTGIDYFTLLRGKIWHHMPENYGLWIIRALIEPDVLHPELLPFQDMAIVRGQIVKSTVRIPSPSPAPGVAKAEEESEAHAEPLGKGAPPGKWQAQRQLQRVGAGQHGAAPPAPDPAPQAAAQQAATPAPGPNRAAGNPAPPAPAASPAPATKPARAAFVQVPMGGRSAQSARSRAVAEDDNNMVMKLAHGAFLSCLVAFAAFGASAAFIGATDAGAAWE